MFHRQRLFGVGLGLVTIAATVALMQQAHQPELTTENVEAEARPSSVPPQAPTVVRPGAWFDDLVAAGHRDPAVRAALMRLKAEGPKAPGTSPERDALIARLIALLPQLDPDLAREVEIALVKQPLRAKDSAAVLAHIKVITDPKIRMQALRKLLENDLATSDLADLLTADDPRVRAAAARSLRRQSLSKNPEEAASAEKALAAAQKSEVDPRVRQAIAAKVTDNPSLFSEDRRNPVVLPPAAERAPAHLIESVWEPTKNSDDFVNRSTISIDHSGMAHVDTLREETDGRWHVSYDAWAWKDGQGNLIIDARGQKVTLIEAPAHGWWIPDSMTIKPDGTTTVIDDHHHGEVGHATQPNNG